MKIFWYLLLTFAFPVLLMGCCGLTPTINPARDVSGTWRGPASYQETVDGARCTITGTFTLTLQQNGNDVAGNFDLSDIAVKSQALPCPQCGGIPPVGCAGPVDNDWPGQVAGTVSSSAITLDSGGDLQFRGSFTTDIMSLSVTRCMLNDEPCTVENASKWKISLTRQS